MKLIISTLVVVAVLVIISLTSVLAQTGSKTSGSGTQKHGGSTSSEARAWKAATAKKSPVGFLRFYRSFPNSKMITVKEGTVSSSMSMTIGSVSSTGTDSVSSSGISVTVDGKDFDWGDDAEKLGLVTYHATPEGYRTVSTLPEQKAKVIRDKKTGKILSVDLGKKL